MAAKNEPITQPEPEVPAQPPAPQRPASGGSYVVNDATGEYTLIERTQPKEQP